MTENDSLNRMATAATGITPTVGQVLAMNHLLRQQIDTLRTEGKDELAGEAQDFLDHFSNVEVELHQQVAFEREYLYE